MKAAVQLTGTDGNVFNVIGRVTAALKGNGQPNEAVDFTNRAFMCESYDEVLRLVTEYVEVE